MKKRWPLYLGFFALLLGGYYYFVFTQTGIRQSGLPVINNNLGAFSLTDQFGRTITERNLEGKVCVAEYFFTTCKGICPKMNTNMRRVYDAFKNEEDFLILSHTCMPETDSVPVLKRYAASVMGGRLVKQEKGDYTLIPDTTGSISIQPGNWLFLTGDKKTLYGLARHGYVIDNNRQDTTQRVEDQFIHTQLFALVDKQSRVRGVYDGLKEDEVQKLLRHIRELLNEPVTTRELK
jgi:protein SCO1/2